MKTKPTTDDPAADAPIRFLRGCVLNSLTRSEQERLYDWLEMYPPKRVLELVQAAAPEGFGIQTHLTTLRRFHARAHEHFQRQLMADTTEALASNDLSDDALESLTLRSIRRAALELSTTHHNSPNHFNVVARWLTKLKQIEQRDKEVAQRDHELNLMERRLELETKKFEFNAARAALIHLTTLREIFLDETKDDEGKIATARKVMFGPAAAAAALAAAQPAIGAPGKGSEAAPLQIVPFPLGAAEAMRKEAVPAQPVPLPPEASAGLETQAEAPHIEPTRDNETTAQPAALSLELSAGMGTEAATPDHEFRGDDEAPVQLDPLPPEAGEGSGVEGSEEPPAKPKRSRKRRVKTPPPPPRIAMSDREFTEMEALRKQ